MYHFAHPIASDAPKDGAVPVDAGGPPWRSGPAASLHPDLLALLKAEPAVVSYVAVDGGLADVRYWGGRVLVGVIPVSGVERLRVEKLKRDHERDGRRVVLVPEARLLRRPFRDNRRLIAGAAATTLGPDDRVRVLEAIDKTGSAELGDLVRLVGTGAAAAGILALVAQGVLCVDLGKPVDGRSLLGRFDPLS